MPHSFVVKPEGATGFAVVHKDMNWPLVTGLTAANAQFAASVANQVANLYQNPTVLYHGENDQHEYWQSAHGEGYALLRVLQETAWSAHRVHGTGSFAFLFFAPTLEEACERLNVKLDRDQEWVANDSQDSTATLQPIKADPDSTITLPEVCTMIAEALSFKDGDFVEEIAGQVLPEEALVYVGDSLFERRIGKEEDEEEV
jgi:hypothetical protein